MKVLSIEKNLTRVLTDKINSQRFVFDIRHKMGTNKDTLCVYLKGFLSLHGLNKRQSKKQQWEHVSTRRLYRAKTLQSCINYISKFIRYDNNKIGAILAAKGLTQISIGTDKFTVIKAQHIRHDGVTYGTCIGTSVLKDEINDARSLNIPTIERVTANRYKKVRNGTTHLYNGVQSEGKGAVMPRYTNSQVKRVTTAKFHTNK